MPALTGISLPQAIRPRRPSASSKLCALSPVRRTGLRTTLIPIWGCPSFFQVRFFNRVKKNYISRRDFLYFNEIYCDSLFASEKKGNPYRIPLSSSISRISPEQRSPWLGEALVRRSSSRAGRHQPPYPAERLQVRAPWQPPAGYEDQRPLP